ncbi:MAG: YeeE/YedE thiosulfate transporter family protein [Vicinamibacterales bacterium]
MVRASSTGTAMMNLLREPWPWYIGGPLIGLMVPLLLLIGGKAFGVSASLRHMCAATVPGGIPLFTYDWKRDGGWNLLFSLGILIGGFIAGRLLLPDGDSVAISAATQRDLRALGIHDLSGLVPQEWMGWHALTSARGWITLGIGGFLVGFGSRWAGGCTSGHAISGLATFQLPSLLAVLGFFAGGLLMTHAILPFLF